MPFIFTYPIKLSFAIAIFYCMYRFALRQLTFYRWNRYFLAGYGLLSLVLPFVNIDFLLPGGGESVITSIPSINNVSLRQLSAATHHRYWLMEYYPSILLWIFSSGAVYVIIRVVFQYRSLLSIRKAAVLIGSEDVELYDVDADISPFSFNNSIYFNSSLHGTDELAKILQHEFVHVKQKHIIDLIIAEFLCIINWFNPFVWLLRKAIRQNLEFIADQQVLESGIDAKQYQYLLLKVTGITPLGLTNHFNISSLKKRIAMMNKMRTAKVHLLKFLFILPLLSLVLVSFRNATVAKDKTINLELKEVAQQKPDTLPQPPPPPPSQHPMGVRKTPPPPLEPLIEERPILHLEKKDLPKDVNSITMSRQLTVKRKDGKTETYDMNSLEDMKAYENKYGKLVPPPPPPAPPAPVERPTSLYLGAPGSASKENAAAGAVASNAGLTKLIVDGREPLIFLDGKELPPGSNLNEAISPDNIETIAILKGVSATSQYGEKALNGVVNITSKGSTSSKIPAEGTDLKPLLLNLPNYWAQKKISEGPQKATIYFDNKDGSYVKEKDFKGLILLDSKEITMAELYKLNGENIKSISVIKDAALLSKYGTKGENGVLQITSK